MCPTCIEKSLDYLVQNLTANEKAVTAFYQGVRFVEMASRVPRSIKGSGSLKSMNLAPFCIPGSSDRVYAIESRCKPILGSLGIKAVVIFQHHQLSPLPQNVAASPSSDRSA